MSESSAQLAGAHSLLRRRARGLRESAVIALGVIASCCWWRSHPIVPTIPASPRPVTRRSSTTASGPIGAWLADCCSFCSAGRPICFPSCWWSPASRSCATAARRSPLARQQHRARGRIRAGGGRELRAGEPALGRSAACNLPRAAWSATSSRSTSCGDCRFSARRCCCWRRGWAACRSPSASRGSRSWIGWVPGPGRASAGRARAAGLRGMSRRAASASRRARMPRSTEQKKIGRAGSAAHRGAAAGAAQERARGEGAAGAAVRSARRQRAAAAEAAGRSAAGRAVVFGRGAGGDVAPGGDEAQGFRRRGRSGRGAAGPGGDALRAAAGARA